MIKIIERQSIKMPSETSLFISFPYQKIIIDMLKTFSLYRYDKKTTEWELPVSDLSLVVNRLSDLDDISLKLFDDSTPQNKLLPQVEYKTKPYSYQLDGIIYGLNHNKWLLTDDMGLGKTLQMIYLAEELYSRGEISHCLIICCVASLRENWKAEIKKHSTLSSVIIGQKDNKYFSISQRAEQLKNKINEFFVIVNIETLRDKKVIDAIKKSENKFDLIIVDEIHKCSSLSSIQSKNLMKLKSKYQVGLTGTPLINNLENLYLPLKWIGALDCGLTEFKKYYFVKGGFANREVIGYQNTEVIKEILAKHSLRRTKDILDLPEKTYINEIVELSDQHKLFYNSVKSATVEEAKVSLNKNKVLSLVIRLRQATSCPSVLTEQDIKSSKLDRAKQLIDDIISNNDSVVVFTSFKNTIYELSKMISNYSCLICTGDQSDEEISKNIDDFQNGKSNILIGTWQCCGTGLTMTRARYMIWIDTPFTNASYQQGCDRIYRIGQKNNVFIYNLICKDTIDERVAEIVKSKEILSDYIIDDDIKNSEILSELRKYIENL